MARLTNEDAIKIFEERLSDLDQYKDVDVEKISDYTVREKIRFRKSLYEINKRLWEIVTGRDLLH
jgi:hypothetical protein